jgi:hypothetical protein
MPPFPIKTIGTPATAGELRTREGGPTQDEGRGCRAEARLNWLYVGAEAPTPEKECKAEGRSEASSATTEAEGAAIAIYAAEKHRLKPAPLEAKAVANLKFQMKGQAKATASHGG